MNCQENQAITLAAPALGLWSAEPAFGFTVDGAFWFDAYDKKSRERLWFIWSITLALLAAGLFVVLGAELALVGPPVFHCGFELADWNM